MEIKDIGGYNSHGHILSSKRQFASEYQLIAGVYKQESSSVLMSCLWVSTLHQVDYCGNRMLDLMGLSGRF